MDTIFSGSKNDIFFEPEKQTKTNNLKAKNQSNKAHFTMSVQGFSC
jgi:hypothetical protein